MTHAGTNSGINNEDCYSDKEVDVDGQTNRQSQLYNISQEQRQEPMGEKHYHSNICHTLQTSGIITSPRIPTNQNHPQIYGIRCF